MRYFKVKIDSDQIAIHERKNGGLKKTGFLVKNELCTTKEMIKRQMIPNKPNFVKNYFDVIECSPKNTFFFFGARFEKQTTK